MPSFVLQITGNADLPKLAEQANLRISTSSTGLNKQFVSDEVLTTAKYIEDMIIQVQTRAKSVDPEGLAVAHWSQTSLSTNSWIEHHPRPHVQGYDRTGSPFPVSGLFARNVGGSNSDTAVVPVRRYRARIEFDVRFRDFALLSDFSSHLTSLEHCEIESLEWVLLPETQEEYKSQLRLKAAQDARAKVKDYCQVVCPHEDVTIIPTELIGENISGGLFSGAGRLRDNYSHSFGIMSGASLFGTNKLGVGASTDPTPSAELSFAPQVINMTLAVIFKFMVETNGFKLSSI